MLSIDEARSAVLAQVAALDLEAVPLREALGRVLASDVVAAGDVPAFDNSAMDGFAVRSGPAERTLRIVDESRAGTPATRALADGEAIRISTGAEMPAGADAVVQVEHTSERDGAVRLHSDVAPADNVRGAGGDLRAGTVVLRAGERLGPAAVGAAAAAGAAQLSCGRRPRLAIVATGDELVDPGAPLGPGQIHDSNSLSLAGLGRRAGAEPLVMPRVGDTQDATQAGLARALDAADVVVAAGAVSVGPHDHVKGALHALGVREVFWRVALRPGRPTWFGIRDDDRTLVFGLPGNPVSAYVTFVLFVRPALNALQGAPALVPRTTAELAQPVARHPDRDECVRVTLRDGRATPTGPQDSHLLSSLVHADALAVIERGTGELAAGETVEIEAL